jgi:AcrR family transcriptional regulator
MSSDRPIDFSHPVATAATRRRPHQRRSLRTLGRILQAASELLKRLPFDEVTTTSIGAECGVSVGALYRFFPDKQAIIDEIFDRHFSNFALWWTAMSCGLCRTKSASWKIPNSASCSIA